MDLAWPKVHQFDSGPATFRPRILPHVCRGNSLGAENPEFTARICRKKCTNTPWQGFNHIQFFNLSHPDLSIFGRCNQSNNQKKTPKFMTAWWHWNPAHAPGNFALDTTDPAIHSEMGLPRFSFLGGEQSGRRKWRWLHPRKPTWNPKFVVCSSFSYSKGVFLGSMIIFRGVSKIVSKDLRYDSKESWHQRSLLKQIRTQLLNAEEPQTLQKNLGTKKLSDSLAASPQWFL